MERVTPETVDAVARLARLSLEPEERELFARQLADILAWADSLAELETEGVPPMAHPGHAPALREDEPRPGLDREAVLEDAPDPAEGLFRVPRVLGG